MIATYPKGGKVKQINAKRGRNQRVGGNPYVTRAALGDSDEQQLDRVFNFYGKKNPVERSFSTENGFSVPFRPLSPV